MIYIYIYTYDITFGTSQQVMPSEDAVVSPVPCSPRGLGAKLETALSKGTVQFQALGGCLKAGEKSLKSLETYGIDKIYVTNI